MMPSSNGLVRVLCYSAAFSVCYAQLLVEVGACTCLALETEVLIGSVALEGVTLPLPAGGGGASDHLPAQGTPSRAPNPPPSVGNESG